MTERKWYEYSQGLHRRIKALEAENRKMREVLRLTAQAALLVTAEVASDDQVGRKVPRPR